MIFLTGEEREKLKLVDKLFSTLTLHELEELVEQEEVVSRLKNITIPVGPVMKIYDETSSLRSDLEVLKYQNKQLLSDVKRLTDVLSTTLFQVPYSGDFYSLKNEIAGRTY